MQRALIIGLFATVLGAAPASAGDVKAHCEAYAAENSGDASGCACLDAAAANDARLKTALLAIKTPADLEATDEATQAAIGACYPEPAPAQ
jgi:hypothetical protein